MLLLLATAGCDLGDEERPELGAHLVAQFDSDRHGDCVVTDMTFPFGESNGHLVGFCLVEPEDDDPYVACITFADAKGNGGEEIEFHGAERLEDVPLGRWETPGCGPAMRRARPWLEERTG